MAICMLLSLVVVQASAATTTDGLHFAAIAGVVIAALDDAVDNGIIMKQNGKGCYNVVIPKRADATDEQARNRVIPPIEWGATVRGGVHGVKVTGTLTVALVTANE